MNLPLHVLSQSEKYHVSLAFSGLREHEHAGQGQAYFLQLLGEFLRFVFQISTSSSSPILWAEQITDSHYTNGGSQVLG